MKSVLASIKPEYCKLIASGQKTVEIRKTRPKIDTLFRCYIYETKASYAVWHKGATTKYGVGCGKVIGEFVCDRISEYEMEWCGGFAEPVYQDIREIYYDDYLEDETFSLVASNEMTNSELNKCSLLADSCLSFDDIGMYVCGKKDFGFHTFYGWHISDLKIYDKPKGLDEFRSYCKYRNDDGSCRYREVECNSVRFDVNPDYSVNFAECLGGKPLSRPPQSWRYIEELDEIWSVKND